MSQISGADALKSTIKMTILGSPKPPSFIYTPWDYLSINTFESINAVVVTNVLLNALSIKVYCANLNGTNITVLTASGSQ